MKKILIFLAVLALFGAGCDKENNMVQKPSNDAGPVASTKTEATTDSEAQVTVEEEKKDAPTPVEPSYKMQEVSFLTSDGVKIVGNWFPAKGKEVVLLLHMRPATKESWDEFAKVLNGAGYRALAIDLRGHGESIIQNGQTINYENFPGGSHAACRLDVDAALKWLEERGMPISSVSVVGGSIGANLALDALARYSGLKQAIALSPGLEYLGVSAEEAVKKMRAGQYAYMLASKDDKYSYDSVVKMAPLKPDLIAAKYYENAGHATNMFSAESDLMGELVTWLMAPPVSAPAGER